MAGPGLVLPVAQGLVSFDRDFERFEGLELLALR